MRTGKMEPPMPFPIKLMTVLDDDNHPDVITWLPEGTGFIIIDKKKFESHIMPKYFKDSKYTSFTRRLRRWAFVIRPHGHKKASYFHPLFMKGFIDRCCEMKPSPQQRKLIQVIADVRRQDGCTSNSRDQKGASDASNKSGSIPVKNHGMYHPHPPPTTMRLPCSNDYGGCMNMNPPFPASHMPLLDSYPQPINANPLHPFSVALYAAAQQQQGLGLCLGQNAPRNPFSETPTNLALLACMRREQQQISWQQGQLAAAAVNPFVSRTAMDQMVFFKPFRKI